NDHITFGADISIVYLFFLSLVIHGSRICVPTPCAILRSDLIVGCRWRVCLGIAVYTIEQSYKKEDDVFYFFVVLFHQIVSKIRVCLKSGSFVYSPVWCLFIHLIAVEIQTTIVWDGFAGMQGRRAFS